MKQIPLAAASATQVAAFAQTNLGLEVDRRMGLPRLLAALTAAGYDKDHIEVEDAAPAAVQPPRQAPKAAAPEPRKRRMATILIATQEYRGGDQPVPVSVNGRAMWIERAKPQTIPYEYYEALMHAVKLVYDPNPAPEGGLLPPREVPTYPVTTISVDPAPDAIAA